MIRQTGQGKVDSRPREDVRVAKAKGDRACGFQPHVGDGVAEGRLNFKLSSSSSTKLTTRLANEVAYWGVENYAKTGRIPPPEIKFSSRTVVGTVRKNVPAIVLSHCPLARAKHRLNIALPLRPHTK
jgi:hypothetical protein